MLLRDNAMKLIRENGLKTIEKQNSINQLCEMENCICLNLQITS